MGLDMAFLFVVMRLVLFAAALFMLLRAIVDSSYSNWKLSGCCVVTGCAVVVAFFATGSHRRVQCGQCGAFRYVSP